MPKLLFVICKLIGFSLLFLSWITSGGAAGFFPIIILLIMTAARYRLPKWWFTIIIDGLVLVVLAEWIPLSVFVISEVFYRVWADERKHGLEMRDIESSKYYELEQQQGDLMTSVTQIERMTAAGERARIARELHDNAGHEIVSAYISLTTVKELLEEKSEKTDEDTEILELYEAALARLDSGVKKIRDAAHNLAPLTALGIEVLQETCKRFPVCEVEFASYGNLSAVPAYCWNLLEACLNEALTNIMRHSEAKQVKVELGVMPNLVRLCIENDGVKSKLESMGIGLRNLRHRASAVGGNISVDAGEIFQVICVVPIKELGVKE